MEDAAARFFSSFRVKRRFKADMRRDSFVVIYDELFFCFLNIMIILLTASSLGRKHP